LALQPTEASDEYPYYGFMPLLGGKVVPGAAAISFEGECFKVITVSATLNSGSIDLEFNFQNAKALLCSETMLLGTVEAYKIEEVAIRGTKKVSWDISASSSANVWDATHNGIRVFTFNGSLQSTLNSIAKTAELFEPCATKPVAGFAANVNIDFLSKYRGINMVKRAVTDVILNETDIHSGDFFGVMRLDGLDPMLAWAMGATTGHTTIALWEGNDLYICESTATSSYWDVNGIQRTLYREWIAKAKAASYNVIHAPLAPEFRAKFNETQAWEWFRTVEGYNYGYNNMFWGWIDTEQLNYPCVAPDFTRCLTWDIIEVVFPLIARYVPTFHSFYDQAFNKRLGTTGLDFGGILQEANAQGIVAKTLPTIVEQDNFVYNTTRNGAVADGPSMVCCVFVCHLWKAAGLFAEFDDEINCAELTNWDDYSMRVFDSNYVRPQACVDADPDSVVCQLLGEYSMAVDHYNSKAPFAHMGEHCPGVAPDYARPDNC